MNLVSFFLLSRAPCTTAALAYVAHVYLLGTNGGGGTTNADEANGSTAAAEAAEERAPHPPPFKPKPISAAPPPPPFKPKPIGAPAPTVNAAVTTAAVPEPRHESNTVTTKR